MIVWLESEARRRAAKALESAVEIGSAPELHPAEPGPAEVYSGVDLEHGAPVRGQGVHWPDRDLAVAAVKESHANEARLADLTGDHRVIEARRLRCDLL